MSRNYDNWERLVAGVLRREQDWKTCHEQSITTISSQSSFSSDFGLNFSFSDDFESPKDVSCLKSAQPLEFQIVASIRNSSVMSKEKGGQLVLFKGSPFAFGLEELLMAPSFALGEKVRTFRSTYAVRFKEDVMVVVKRWGRGNATRQVLEQRLKTIQSMEHDNVVSLRGYFFDKDDSFGFYDYFHQGNLHTILHGKKGEQGSVGLDWEGRMRIAIGAAKGLLHIHQQSGNSFVHGSVKTSNIFVNSEEYGCVDINPEIAISYYYQDQPYHSPEITTTKKLSQASDVYCFGVVLLELLTGRSPFHFHYNICIESFADWAIRNARDEWTTIVFDRELLKYSLAKQGMRDMLGVAFCCVEKKPEERPDMKHVVHMLQFIPTSYPPYSD